MKNLIWIYGRSVKRRKAINEMSGNIPGRNFLGRNFSGESLRGGNFSGGFFQNGYLSFLQAQNESLE